MFEICGSPFPLLSNPPPPLLAFASLSLLSLIYSPQKRRKGISIPPTSFIPTSLTSLSSRYNVRFHSPYLPCYSKKLDRTFKVEIERKKSVIALKVIIREKVGPYFDEVPVYELDLYQDSSGASSHR